VVVVVAAIILIDIFLAIILPIQLLLLSLLFM